MKANLGKTVRAAGSKVGNKVSKTVLKNDALRPLAFGSVIARLIKNPNNTMQVFELDDMISDSATPEQKKAYIDYFKSLDPSTSTMFEERYLSKSYDLSKLSIYQPGTLGYAYYKHMTDNGFSPDFFPPVEVTDDSSYLKLRLRQTHDIWHVITGYNPTVIGEIALQAFYHGQASGMLNSLLIGAGMLHISMFDIKNSGLLLDAITEGRQRGLSARKLAPIKWEEMWERPLGEVRRELGVTDGKIAQLDLPTEISSDQVAVSSHQAFEENPQAAA